MNTLEVEDKKSEYKAKICGVMAIHKSLSVKISENIKGIL